MPKSYIWRQMAPQISMLCTATQSITKPSLALSIFRWRHPAPTSSWAQECIEMDSSQFARGYSVRRAHRGWRRGNVQSNLQARPWRHREQEAHVRISVWTIEGVAEDQKSKGTGVNARYRWHILRCGTFQQISFGERHLHSMCCAQRATTQNNLWQPPQEFHLPATNGCTNDALWPRPRGHFGDGVRSGPLSRGRETPILSVLQPAAKIKLNTSLLALFAQRSCSELFDLDQGTRRREPYFLSWRYGARWFLLPAPSPYFGNPGRQAHTSCRGYFYVSLMRCLTLLRLCLWRTSREDGAKRKTALRRSLRNLIRCDRSRCCLPPILVLQSSCRLKNVYAPAHWPRHALDEFRSPGSPALTR